MAVKTALRSESVSTDWFTVDEAATRYKVHPKSIRNWIDEGKLSAVRLCRQWRISSAEIARIDKEGV